MAQCERELRRRTGVPLTSPPLLNRNGSVRGEFGKDGRGEGEQTSNLPWSVWIFTMELTNQFRGSDVLTRFPRSFLITVSLPENFVLKFLSEYTAIEYLFDFVMGLVVDDLGERWRSCLATLDGIRDGWEELDDVEDRMDALHGTRKEEAVGEASDLTLHSERSEVAMRQFLRGSCR